MTASVRSPDQPAAWLGWVASARAWLFLAFLIIAFEIWSQASFQATFLANPYNIRSIAVFAVAPLLLARVTT